MSRVLVLPLLLISAVNSAILTFGRNIAWMALALMVIVILVQVFFRYVLNNALPWPDEAARFLMLWMMGLIAPLALRQGGFVAIDTVPRALPAMVAKLLMLVLLVLSCLVLVTAIQLGWKHTMGFGGNFDSSSLKLPLDWFGGESMRVKLRYMYGSLLVCVILMLAVTVELILRTLINLIDPNHPLPHIGGDVIAGAD
ncbi:TRAP transporter small permease [Algirhabdus cladophorae]|uniref:TRAP transporter small permease n=1 Tax=Algirhabdus cladophorae TaxID=3377108 RepID=UPI003B845C53